VPSSGEFWQPACAVNFYLHDKCFSVFASALHTGTSLCGFDSDDSDDFSQYPFKHYVINFKLAELFYQLRMFELLSACAIIAEIRAIQYSRFAV